MAEKVAKILTDEKGRTFEARIAQAFNGKPLTKVAEQLGFNYHTFRNYAQQRTDIPPDVLLAIAKSANVSVDWLLTGEEPQGKQNGHGNVIQMPQNVSVNLNQAEMEGLWELAERESVSPGEMIAILLRRSFGRPTIEELEPQFEDMLTALDKMDENERRRAQEHFVGKMMLRRVK